MDSSTKSQCFLLNVDLYKLSEVCSSGSCTRSLQVFIKLEFGFARLYKVVCRVSGYPTLERDNLDVIARILRLCFVVLSRIRDESVST